MPLPFIGAGELAELLSMPDAIDALERTFSTTPPPTAPDRQHVAVPGGDLLLMPATNASGTGVKIVTVAEGNAEHGLPLIHGVYVLFSPGTLEPRAMFDGAALTRIRTAAVSGLATRHLALPLAKTLVVFGGGTQGKAHIEAMQAVRPIEVVHVLERADLDHGVVKEADIVCTCTTSPTPVFDGSLLAPGAHVNAVGAYKPTTRELDDVAIASGRVVVETLGAPLQEAGDLIEPIRSGVISAEKIESLSEVIAHAPRRSDDEITIFKSVGVAFEDLAIAIAAYERST